MKKILIIAPDSIHTKKFIGMLNSNYQVTLLLQADQEQVNSIKINDYNVEKIICKNSLQSVPLIYKTIASCSPDYIHIHTANKLCFITVLINKIFFRTKVVVSTWGSDVLVVPYKSFFYKVVVGICLKLANVVTYDSFVQKFVMQSIYKKLPKLTEFNFGLPSEIVDEKGSLAKEDLIYSSRSHSANYNIEQILSAFNDFYRIHKSYKLIISGVPDPKITPKLNEMIAELGLEEVVKIVGLVSPIENAKYMKRAKIYISIPTSDAKSISIMEAISSNCIVLASDIPANYGLVVDGVNGILSEPNALDISKFSVIDNSIMEKVNVILTYKMTKQYNKDILLKIYDDLKC